METPYLLINHAIHMKHLERLIVVMYAKYCGCAYVNDARKQLFTQRRCSLEDIHPTHAALYQHIKHSLFQAEYRNNHLLTKTPF